MSMKKKTKMVHLTPKRWEALHKIAVTLRGERGANVSVQELVNLAVDLYLEKDETK